ncbi:unnamed protein product [Aspergillus oryzae RIB40]|uniref:DNA, SC138 n=1 Tax=Aspergillus oryzae (strain ATCC 42149 / RIB 40) TaxID=510516 RepID=Q2U1L8_ASPOR|nr:unnamed protein product [Aspergillus oryzae RIB40]BAE64547.1 unnamed protein product [Aspergillus oryzae RIB40]
MEATSSLEDKFVERVKSRGAHFGSDSSGLDGHQLKTIQSCFEIFAESALDSLSQAQQYRILRVRKLFRKVYSTLGPVMVVLCMLADSVTNIAKLNLEILIPKLWDQIYVPKKGLKDAATALCQEHQAVLESSDTSLRKRKRNQNSLHRDVVGKASLPTTAQQVREEGSEADRVECKGAVFM